MRIYHCADRLWIFSIKHFIIPETKSKPELRFSANTWIWCKSTRNNTVCRESCQQQLNLPYNCNSRASNAPEDGHKDALKLTSSSQAYLPSVLRAQQPEILAPEYAGSVFMTGAQRPTDERSALGRTHTQTLSAPALWQAEESHRTGRNESEADGRKTKLCFPRRFGFVFSVTSV